MSYSHFYPAKKYRWHVTPLYIIKEMLLTRQANDLDNQILITGARRGGKSTICGKILFQFEDFNPYDSMVYSKEATFKQLKKKNNYVWMDEAVINSARGNVMTRANKLLFEVTTINGENHNMVFFIMPFVEDFDTKILQYITAWIHVDKRGLAVLLLPENKGIFGKRNWDIVQMKKIFEEFQKENQQASHMPYWIYNNFRGYIKFGKLPKHQQEVVNEIKNIRKSENLDKEMKDNIVFEAKEVENYSKYSAKNLTELIIKGEIRSIEQFNKTCEEYKLLSDEILKKCDNILKKNNINKTVKGIFREKQKEDQLIKF